jgi:hypothetical protein
MSQSFQLDENEKREPVERFEGRVSMKWKTKLTKHFPCRVPLVGAPMAGVAGGLLAAETCRAGALGFIAAGTLENLDHLEEQIAIFRKHAPPGAPLCLGFLGFASLDERWWESYQSVLERHKPQVVQVRTSRFWVKRMILSSLNAVLCTDDCFE